MTRAPLLAAVFWLAIALCGMALPLLAAGQTATPTVTPTVTPTPVCGSSPYNVVANSEQSLRDAVFCCNANGGTVNVPAGTYTLTSDEMYLCASTCTVAGANQATTIITGADNFRIFNTDQNGCGGATTMHDLTLTHGNGFGVVPGFGDGGCMQATDLTLTNVTISHCSSTTNVGGLNASGSTFTATGSTFDQNTTTGVGGGLEAGANTIALTDVTFTNNTAGSDGGGFIMTGTSVSTLLRCVATNNISGGTGGGGRFDDNAASVTSQIVDSSFSGNQAVDGGGLIIAESGTGHTLLITGSTISGNTASSTGGGIRWTTRPGQVANSTITGNTATNSDGGGVWASVSVDFFNTTIAANSAPSGSGGNLRGTSLTAANVIVSGGTPDNCVSSVSEAVNNNIESGTDCGFTSGQQSTNPLLSALASNGGPTQTMSLQGGSPALDAGDDTACAAAPVSGVDQRGISRPQFAHCDIGAFEAEATPTPTDTPTPTETATPTPTDKGCIVLLVTPTTTCAAAIEGFTTPMPTPTPGDCRQDADQATCDLVNGGGLGPGCSCIRHVDAPAQCASGCAPAGPTATATPTPTRTFVGVQCLTTQSDEAP